MDNRSENVNERDFADRYARGARSQPWLGRALLTVGIGGAAFVALCCATPLLLAAIGVGFILKDSVLIMQLATHLLQPELRRGSLRWGRKQQLPVPSHMKRPLTSLPALS